MRSQDADRWPRLWRRTKEKQQYLCSLPCVLLSASVRAIFSRWLQLSVQGLSGALGVTEKEKLFVVDKRWWWWWGGGRWRRSRSGLGEVGRRRDPLFTASGAVPQVRTSADCLLMRRYVRRNSTHSNRPVSNTSINQKHSNYWWQDPSRQQLTPASCFIRILLVPDGKWCDAFSAELGCKQCLRELQATFCALQPVSQLWPLTPKNQQGQLLFTGYSWIANLCKPWRWLWCQTSNSSGTDNHVHHVQITSVPFFPSILTPACDFNN